jgi:hypothetical protein
MLPVGLGAVLLSANTMIAAINAQPLGRLRLREPADQPPTLQPSPA